MSAIISTMAENSRQIHAAAGEMTDKLKTLVAWLALFPSRTETEHVVKDLTLLFCRQGKEWVLLVKRDDEDFRQVFDTSLAIKLAVIDAMPDLLQAMTTSQGILLKTIDRGSIALDKLFDQYGVMEDLAKVQGVLG